MQSVQVGRRQAAAATVHEPGGAVLELSPLHFTVDDPGADRA
jgi:hypothetical protein